MMMIANPLVIILLFLMIALLFLLQIPHSKKLDSPGRKNRSPEVAHRVASEHPLYNQSMEVLEQARSYVRELQELTQQIEETAVKAEIRQLCELTAQITAKVAQDPGNLPLVQRHCDYYLRTTRDLVAKYAELIHSPYYTNEMEYQVKRIEQLIGGLREHFHNCLRKLLRYEMLRVEVEVNTLERMIRKEKPAAEQHTQIR